MLDVLSYMYMQVDGHEVAWLVILECKVWNYILLQTTLHTCALLHLIDTIPVAEIRSSRAWVLLHWIWGLNAMGMTYCIHSVQTDRLEWIPLRAGAHKLNNHLASLLSLFLLLTDPSSAVLCTFHGVLVMAESMDEGCGIAVSAAWCWAEWNSQRRNVPVRYMCISFTVRYRYTLHMHTWKGSGVGVGCFM